MRKLKFRVWDDHEKIWLLGYGGLGGFRLTGEMVTIGEWSNVFWNFIRDEDKEFSDLKIMQYTGLKDRNGTEIYEGDIIRKPYLYDEFSGDAATGYWEWRHEIRVVTYKNGMFCYDGEDFKSITQYPDTEHFKEHYPLPDNFITGFEVIGNIYENPELLEEE